MHPLKRHLSEFLCELVEIIKAMLVIAIIVAGSIFLAFVWLAIIQALRILN